MRTTTVTIWHGSTGGGLAAGIRWTSPTVTVDLTDLIHGPLEYDDWTRVGEAGSGARIDRSVNAVLSVQF